MKNLSPSFYRVSQRSGNEAAELPSTGASFLVGALRKVRAGATLEEIGWTPIRLRRWLRVKRRIRIVEDSDALSRQFGRVLKLLHAVGQT